MWMEETIGKKINLERTEEAVETKAEVIASACPFCQVMVQDGLQSMEDANAESVKVENKSRTVQTLDIAEIVARSI